MLLFLFEPSNKNNLLLIGKYEFLLMVFENKLAMSDHGAALQTYNQELVKCNNSPMFAFEVVSFVPVVGLEGLKVKKCEIMNVIRKEEAEKVVLEKNLRSLQEKLNQLNSNLQQHKSLYDNYDRTIKETENGFKKVLNNINLSQIVYYSVTDFRKFSNIIKLGATRGTRVRK